MRKKVLLKLTNGAGAARQKEAEAEEAKTAVQGSQ